MEIANLWCPSCGERRVIDMEEEACMDCKSDTFICVTCEHYFSHLEFESERLEEHLAKARKVKR